MSLQPDRCICLRKFEYSETSQILTMLARQSGLIRLIAKGAHRKTKAGASKFGGGIDLLEVGQAVFTFDTRKDLSTLCEWTLLEGHLPLRSSLRGLYLGQYAAELITMLFQEHDPHPLLFDRLEQSLLEFATPRREEAFLSYELDLLREAGFLPELQNCIGCGRVMGNDMQAYFSPGRGGVACRSCESTIPDRMSLDGRLLRLLQGILRLPRNGAEPQRLPRLTRHQTDPLNRLLAFHIEHTLGRRLRLREYVLENQKPETRNPKQ